MSRFNELWIKVVGRKLWQAMAMVAESRVWLGGVISATRDTALITALVTRVHASLTRRDLRRSAWMGWRVT